MSQVEWFWHWKPCAGQFEYCHSPTHSVPQASHTLSVICAARAIISYARGEATEESDIDLRIDYTELVFKTIFGYGGLFADMEDALEKSVDIVSTNALREKINDPPARRFIKSMKREEKLIYTRGVIL